MVSTVFLLAAAIQAASAPPAAAAPLERPTGVSLVDCRLGRINFETRSVQGPTRRFVLLLGAPQGERHETFDIRVFDPENLLMNERLEGAFFSEDPNMLFAQTNTNRPNYFRLAVSLPRATGALGMNGSGSAEEHMAHSYMGDCTISAPADAAARFDALRASQ